MATASSVVSAASSAAAAAAPAGASAAAVAYPFVDTHTHLHFLSKKIPEKLTPATYGDFARVFPPGFEGCVNVFCEPADFAEADQWLAHAGVYGAFGVHPHNASEYTQAIEDQMVAFMAHPKTVAWGEVWPMIYCGLDYHYDNSPREVQRDVFERQCKAAVRCAKPLVVHTREAEEDTLRIMKAELPREHRVHVHCFTSSKAMALDLVEHFPNLCIGFTGVITFKNGKDVREVVAAVPLDRIVMETDAPYMSPEPHRREVCHPGFAALVGKQIAAVKGLDVAVVMAAIRENSRRLYGF